MLDKNGFMKNEVGTCHPAHVNDYKGKFTEDRVFVSNHSELHSRSPGTALEFGLSFSGITNRPDYGNKVSQITIS